MCYTVTVIIWKYKVMYVLYSLRDYLKKYSHVCVIQSPWLSEKYKVMYVLYSHRDYLKNVKSCMCYTVTVIIWQM
jgi:hypothetical protein